jgi:hypothetical protein
MRIAPFPRPEGQVEASIFLTPGRHIAKEAFGCRTGEGLARVYAAADLWRSTWVRRQGMVLNPGHWDEQGAPAPYPAELVTLL